MAVVPIRRAIERMSFFLLCCACLGLAACVGDEVCDEGLTLKDGACTLATQDSADKPDPPEGMGQACSADAECPAAADYCVKQPGAATGICTFKDCTQDPDSCPKGFYCLNLGIFQAGLPTVCYAQ